jgi:hypothetical protein
MDRPDVMQFKNSSTKTRVLRSLAVRSPFAVRLDGQMDRPDVMQFQY